MANEYLSCEEAFKAAIKIIRQELADRNIGSSFRFAIEASGRVQDGEVKVAFKLDSLFYPTQDVTGDSILAVLEEYLHRHGWNVRHAPLTLDYTPVQSGETPEAVQ